MKPTLVGAVNSEICAAASALVLCSSITWVADDFESDPWETSASGFKDRMEILLLPFTSNVTQNEDWQLSKFMRWIAYYFFCHFLSTKNFSFTSRKRHLLISLEVSWDKKAIPQNSIPINQVNLIMLLLTPKKTHGYFIQRNGKISYFFSKWIKNLDISGMKKKSQFLGVGEEPFLNLVTYL